MSSQTTLLFAAIVALLSSVIYGYVGARLGRRGIPPGDARLAWRLFALWWWCLGAQSLVSGVLDILASLRLTILPLFVTVSYINLIVICLALWGLLYYLLYLFTGSRRVLGPLSAFYIAYALFMIYYVTASGPQGVLVNRWSTSLSYASQLTGPLFVLILALLLAPQILAGLAYFAVCFKVKDRTLRYRVVLVSWSIVIWFASPLIALASGRAQSDGWQVANKLIGLLAAFLVLRAYIPPRWVTRRFGISSVNSESRA